MPCEGCRVQFTVFRRKRICADCKRFYCNSCLTTTTAATGRSLGHWDGTPLCERCAIFAKRPLLRTDLLQLKPKDLIFFLQSKHISTAGCVEKDELISLVLNYAQQQQQQTDATSGARRERRRSSSSSAAHRQHRAHGGADTTTNSFLNLKQSCQNFFTNITDNISDSLASFDNRSTAKPRSHSSSAGGGGGSGAASPQTRPDDSPTHIHEQPRVSTREMPSYASFQRTAPADHHNNTPTRTPPILTVRLDDSETALRQTSAPSRSSEETSPVMSSVSSATTHPQEFATTTSASGDGESKWECECSDGEDGHDDDDDEDDDDEIIATYTSSKAGDKTPLNSEEMKTSSIAQKESDRLAAPQQRLAAEEDSSQSSFEELGAIGGISDDSKTTTDTNSSNMEQWHILDTQREELPQQTQLVPNVGQQQMPARTENVDADSLPSVSMEMRDSALIRSAYERARKITRRRSDGCLKKKRAPSDEDDESPTTSEHVLRRFADNAVAASDEQAPTGTQTAAGEPDEPPRTPLRSCKRCGKSKLNIRRQVEKMRLHLESSQMSETDIKNELREFLAYLERRTKSVDYSEDSETAASSAMGNHYTPDSEALAAAASIAAAFAAVVDADGYSEMDDDDGINVYATPAGYNGNRRDSRFIQLEDFQTMEELEGLTVKQLKEILMLNRVDFKGCCEKQELLERVERLWKNLKSTPAIEKLQTDELCKICMDAPIECVILECGHMATCTNCGKVLSECPICRQYIVRVVRFFRA